MNTNTQTPTLKHQHSNTNTQTPTLKHQHSNTGTAPSIANDTAYPNVARLSTSENRIQNGLTALAKHFGWRKIGIIHSDSTWGSQSAAKFKETYVEAEVLHEIEVTLNEFDNSPYTHQVANCTTWLQEFQDRDVYVLFLYLEPRVARSLYVASYTTQIMAGNGYAYVNGWITESIILNDDGSVNLDAVKGAEGSIGLMEKVETTSALAQSYVNFWDSSASIQGCASLSDDTSYCDVDGVSNTVAGYGGLFADSILLLAYAFNSTVNCTSLTQDQCSEAVRGVRARSARI